MCQQPGNSSACPPGPPLYTTNNGSHFDVLHTPSMKHGMLILLPQWRVNSTCMIVFTAFRKVSATPGFPPQTMCVLDDQEQEEHFCSVFIAFKLNFEKHPMR